MITERVETEANGSVETSLEVSESVLIPDADLLSIDPWSEGASDPEVSPKRIYWEPVDSDEDRYEVVMWFAGHVLSADPKKREFVVLLTDQGGVRSRATLDLEDIDARDRDYVVEGAQFTYHVFRDYQHTGLVTTHEILFEPARVWTRDDQAEVDDRLDRIQNYLDRLKDD